MAVIQVRAWLEHAWQRAFAPRKARCRPAGQSKKTLADRLLLAARAAIAAAFFHAEHDSLMSLKLSTYELFFSKYPLPLLPVDLVMHMAGTVQHFIHVLVLLGLATRQSAAVLLAMTAIFAIFAPSDAWPIQLGCAGLLLPLIARGAGRWSLDRLLAGAPAAQA